MTTNDDDIPAPTAERIMRYLAGMTDDRLLNLWSRLIALVRAGAISADSPILEWIADELDDRGRLDDAEEL